jgi:hypothetical protein
MEVTTENTAQGTESNTQSTEATTQTAQGTSASEIVATPSATSASATANANAVIPNQFTPNYKFKSGDFEGEVDEMFRPLIKDADTEKKIKDLFTKAHGLDTVKTRLTGEVESWKGKATESVEKYSALSQSLASLSHHVNRGDFDSFFAALKIPEAQIYKWLQGKVKEQDMSPEEKAERARVRQEGTQLFQLQQQNQILMQNQQRFQEEQSKAALESALTSPDVSALAQQFDTQVGVQGAFRKEVIKHGYTMYLLNGNVDPHPNDVVKDLMGTLGKIIQPQQANGGMQTNNQAGASQKPPIIPNVAGKSASPVKSAPRSIKELREKHAAIS